MAMSRGIDRHFVGLGGRNRDIRVKHLVMQPGNALNTRPSHVTTADGAFEGLLKDSLSRPQRKCPSKDADPELRHSKCYRSAIQN